MPRARNLVVAFAAVGCLLLTSACGADSSSGGDAKGATKGAAKKANSGASAAQGSATVVVDGRTFEFTLRSCVSQADEDLLFSGPGKEEGGSEPSYLDADLTMHEDKFYGGIRIDFGVDQPFKSSDTFIATSDSDPVVKTSPDGITITAPAYDNTSKQLGEAQVRTDCGKS